MNNDVVQLLHAVQEWTSNGSGSLGLAGENKMTW